MNSGNSFFLERGKVRQTAREDKYEKTRETPFYFQEAAILNNELKKLNRETLIDLMKVSDKIADTTFQHINNFNVPSAKRRSALFAYSGTVYQSLNANSFATDDLLYARKHVRILSGLYGVLNPSDMINPYRLEMKMPLKNPDGDNLYHFWKPRLFESLMKENGPIINLASTEYLKAVDKKKLNQQLISFQFKERDGEKVRTVGMYSKVVRGLMARKIITEKITDPFQLQKDEVGGYVYDHKLSTESDWVFARNEIL